MNFHYDTPNSNHKMLKAATKAAHDRTEQCGPFARIFAKDYSRGEYQQLIAKFYGFWDAHRIYTPDSDLLADEVDALEQDLEALGIAKSHLARLPAIYQTHITHPLDAYAINYLRLGSRLGGRVISNKLHQHFGHDSMVPTHYFSLYESDPNAWRAFIDNLNAQHFTEFAMERVIDTTLLLFEKLNDWMSAPMPSVEHNEPKKVIAFF